MKTGKTKMALFAGLLIALYSQGSFAQGYGPRGSYNSGYGYGLGYNNGYECNNGPGYAPNYGYGPQPYYGNAYPYRYRPPVVVVRSPPPVVVAPPAVIIRPRPYMGPPVYVGRGGYGYRHRSYPRWR